MRLILYVIAFIMVIGWIIGFIGYALSGLIHLLLVIAVVAVLFSLIGAKTSGA